MDCSFSHATCVCTWHCRCRQPVCTPEGVSLSSICRPEVFNNNKPVCQQHLTSSRRRSTGGLPSAIYPRTSAWRVVVMVCVCDVQMRGAPAGSIRPPPPFALPLSRLCPAAIGSASCTLPTCSSSWTAAPSPSVVTAKTRSLQLQTARDPPAAS